MRSCICLGLAFLLAISTVQAQTRTQEDDNLLPSPTLTREAIRFEHFNIDDGLSQSSVYDIIQDRRGFIWIATQDGLNRFDGLDFKVYRRIPFDSTSFSANWVWNLAEGPDGAIWAN